MTCAACVRQTDKQTDVSRRLLLGGTQAPPDASMQPHPHMHPSSGPHPTPNLATTQAKGPYSDAHAMPMQCACHVHAMPLPCPCNAHAMRLPCACCPDAGPIRSTRSSAWATWRSSPRGLLRRTSGRASEQAGRARHSPTATLSPWSSSRRPTSRRSRRCGTCHAHAHAMHTQCTCGAQERDMHMPCTCHAHAGHDDRLATAGRLHILRAGQRHVQLRRVIGKAPMYAS